MPMEVLCVVIDSDLLPNFGIIENIIIDYLHSYYFCFREIAYHLLFITLSFIWGHKAFTYFISMSVNHQIQRILLFYQIPHNQSYFVPLKYWNLSYVNEIQQNLEDHSLTVEAPYHKGITPSPPSQNENYNTEQSFWTMDTLRADNCRLWRYRFW